MAAEPGAARVRGAAAEAGSFVQQQAPLLILLGLGALACVLTLLRLDPANGQQESDFVQFYFPTIQAFAENGLAAVTDYPSAPTPAYYVIQGAVLALTDSPVAVRAVSVLLGLAMIWAVWRFPTSTARRLTAIAAVLISPYFRGQTWYANGDVMALLLMVVALHLARSEDRPDRWPGLMFLASFLVYLRQNFLFMPAYLFLLGVFRRRWPMFPVVAFSALSALPMLWLVHAWGGIAPPRFQNHLEIVNIPAVMIVGLTITAVYLSPVLAVRALRPEQLWRDVLGLPIWAHAAIALGVVSVWLFSAGFQEIYGGGLVFIGAQRAEDLLGLPLIVSMTAAFVGSAYLMALLIRSDPWTNVIILLGTLSMSISVLIYQRYFDPMIPLLLILWAKTQEIDWLEQRGFTWILALPSLLIAITVSVTR